MRLRLAGIALRRIGQALSFVEKRPPQGAESVRLRIDGVLDVLRDFPLTGQNTSRPGFRRVVLTPFPYVIVYRVAASEIIVMRFRRTAPRPV